MLRVNMSINILAMVHHPENHELHDHHDVEIHDEHHNTSAAIEQDVS